MTIRNFVQHAEEYPMDVLEVKDLEPVVYQPQMAAYLSRCYWWSQKQIDLLLSIHTAQEIQDVLELIQKEYTENSLVSYWEKPTSKYLYDVLLHAKSN